MGACTYVGRVGGLAVALGVGAAVLGGTSVAWAEDDAAPGPAATTTHSIQSEQDSGTRAARPGRSSTARGGRVTDAERNERRNINPTNDIDRTSREEVHVPAEPETVSAPEPTAPSDDPPARPAAAEAEPSVEVAPATGPEAIVTDEYSLTEPEVAPMPVPMAALLTAAAQTPEDPFADGNPPVPVDSALDWTVLAFARRESLANTAATVSPAATDVPGVTLIMGPSGVPVPTEKYKQTVIDYYIPNKEDPAYLLFTPEGLYPITGVKSLPFNTSTDQGIEILGDTLAKLPPGTRTTVFGYSQSAVISSLIKAGYTIDGKEYTVPQDLPVSFVLIGNEMNPDGGFLSRFSGRDMPMLSLPSLGIDFYGGTLPDGLPVTNYTREYDGFADFPRYPINFLSDLNAGLGIVFVHTRQTPDPDVCKSFCLTSDQVNAAIPLPSSAPSQKYFFIPTENLPLLEPLRMIPLIGTPIADLIQPALRVIVDLGYGDPAHGFLSGPQHLANEVAPFGLFPDVDPAEVFTRFLDGVQQGIIDFVNDFSAGGSVSREIAGLTLPTVSPLALPGSGDLIQTVQNMVTSVTNRITASAAALYAALLPTADIVNALLTTQPAYDLNLFLYGIGQVRNGDLITGLGNAIGLPIAANIGLSTVAGLVGALVWGEAVAELLGLPATEG